MNRKEFRKEYYRVMSRIYTVVNAISERYLEYEKTPAVLDEIIDGEHCAARDVFEYGLFLLARGLPKENVEFVLSNIVETHTDKDRKLLASIQSEAVLYITDENRPPHPFKIICRLDSRVDIKNNAVTRACAEYWRDPSARATFKPLCSKARITIKTPLGYKKAFEQILTRAAMFGEKARHKGFEAMYNEIDVERAAVRDILDYGLLLLRTGLPPSEMDLILSRHIENEKNPAKKRLKRIQKEAAHRIYLGYDLRTTIMVLITMSGLKEREMQKMKENWCD